MKKLAHETRLVKALVKEFAPQAPELSSERESLLLNQVMSKIEEIKPIKVKTDFWGSAVGLWRIKNQEQKILSTAKLDNSLS